MKASMAGQKIGLVNRLRSSWNVLRRYLDGTFGDAKADIAHHRELSDVFQSHVGKDLRSSRILEVGSGQMAKQTALFAADGAEITGIDMEVATYRLSPRVFLDSLRRNGPERAIKSLVRHLLFDKTYLRALSSLYPKPIPYSALDTRVMEATCLEFPDNHFDFVFSEWVFEHIANVQQAVEEINRVLKPGGVAWVLAHLYPSLSGSHNLEWQFPDISPSTSIPPWSHLLGDRYPANTYLNKLRLDQFRSIFQENMTVIDERTTLEGSGILTPELSALLAQRGYTREDLLTATVVFACRKKNA